MPNHWENKNNEVTKKKEKKRGVSGGLHYTPD